MLSCGEVAYLGAPSVQTVGVTYTKLTLTSRLELMFRPFGVHLLSEE